MLLNGKEINNLIIQGEKFSKSSGEIKFINYQVLKLDSKVNGQACTLVDASLNLSAYFNKRVMLFYSFELNDINDSVVTATEPFKFTGQDKVATATNNGNVLVYYSIYNALSIHCLSPWQWTPKPHGSGLILELEQ